jgi:hypothetical protein
MNLHVNEKLEIPLGRFKRLFIYVQCYNDKQCFINIYFYSGLPYSSEVDNKTELFAVGISFRI